MFNITNTLLSSAAAGGAGMLINKSVFHSGFIYLLTLLSIWLLTFTLVVNKSKGMMSYIFVLLTTCVLFAIKTKALLIFYFCYEMCVIPITFIVFLYGYQPEKLQASLSLLLYTVVSSLPLLLYIVYVTDFTFIYSSLVTLLVTISFMVKTPMYLLHTWLPKAHVEAPVGGSMVLAGVLLKLGSYGLLLFLPLVKLNVVISFYFSISLIGSTISSLICLRQGDFKLLVAYSSVVHMGVVTLGFISGSEAGYTCGVIMILSHGLGSPMLFAFAFWLYESSHSRLLLNNTGSWPLLMTGLFALVSLNMSVPPSLGIWAEVYLSISVISQMNWVFPFFLSMLFLSGAYNLYMYTSCMHAKFSSSFSSTETMFYPIAQTLFYGYCSFFCLDLFHV